MQGNRKISRQDITQRKMRHRPWLAGLLSAGLFCLAAGAGSAQESAEPVGPPAALAIPALNVVAVVNDTIVSSVDVQDRMRLIIGTTGLPETQEVRAGLVPQVIRMLIDEALQLQEAQRLSIRVSDEELTAAIAGLEQQRGKEPGSLEAMFQARGLSKRSFMEQIRSQIAWSKVVMSAVRPKIRVSNEEVLQAQQKSSLGETREVRIASILLPVESPADEENVRALSQRLVSEIRGGKDFRTISAQLQGGAPEHERETGFWVQMEDLDPQITAQLSKLRAGEITNPIRTANGYHIVKLYDTREEGSSSASNRTEVALKQILLSLTKEAPDSEVNLMLNIARRISDDPGSCNEPGIAGFKDLDMLEIKSDYLRTAIDHIPARIRDLLQGIAVGGATEPFATPEGIQVIQLCERIEVPVELTLDESVRERLVQERLELEALKYMRNLRREAFVDVRL